MHTKVILLVIPYRHLLGMETGVHTSGNVGILLKPSLSCPRVSWSPSPFRMGFVYFLTDRY